MNKFFIVIFPIIILSLFSFAQISESRHIPGISILLGLGTNPIAFRDSSNMDPQMHVLSLDNLPYLPGDKAMVTVTEADSNLDPNAVDTVMVLLTTPSGFNENLVLMETGIDTGVFSGMINLNGVLAGEVLTVTYLPQHLGVGRLSAELRGVTDASTLDIFDYIIDDPDSLNTRHVEACPVDLVTHPVDLQVTGDFLDFSTGIINSPVFDASSEITVTISYANAILDKMGGGAYLPSELEILWRPSLNGAIGGFGSFSDSPNSDTIILNEAEKTITGTLKNFKFQGTLSGQYALGIVGGNPCASEEGGNLVRPELVIVSSTSIIGGSVGGELIPIDTTSLLIGYSVLNAYWIAPIGIGIGVGIYLVKRKF